MIGDTGVTAVCSPFRSPTSSANRIPYPVLSSDHAPMIDYAIKSIAPLEKELHTGRQDQAIVAFATKAANHSRVFSPIRNPRRRDRRACC
jgi:hypothetical protein